jgi:ankyrin repeat protein
MVGLAGKEGHLDIVKFLIERGVDILSNDRVALNWTASSIHADCMDYMIKTCNVSKDVISVLLSHTCYNNNHIDMLKVFLKHGANPMYEKNKGSSEYNSSLKYAIKNNFIDAAKLLIEAGASIKSEDIIITRWEKPQEITFFVDACEQGLKDMIKLLIEYGVDIHWDKEMALMMACKYSQYDIVKILLEHGADPTVRKGLALRYAKDPEIKKLLKKYYNKTNENFYPHLLEFERGQDPIKAMDIGHDIYMWSKIKTFVRNKQPNLYDSEIFEINQVLQSLAMHNEVEMIDFLIKRKNAKIDGFECKPLRAAVFFGCLETVEYLLNNGAIVTATHLREAKERGDEPIYALIRASFLEQQHKKNPRTAEIQKARADHARQKWLKRLELKKKKTNETLDFNFTRGQDPLDSMEIGEHYKIKKWLREIGLKDTEYEILPDLKINVFTDVNLIDKNLNKLPPYIYFNEIYGGFYASENEFISLEGFPKEVFDDLSLFANRNKRWTTEEIKKQVNVLGTIYH